MTDDEKLKNILIQQANITCFEIATFCAECCDKHRGHLQVGDMIRQHFGLTELEKILPKRDDVPKTEVKPEAKKSHLSLVKGSKCSTHQIIISQN